MRDEGGAYAERGNAPSGSAASPPLESTRQQLAESAKSLGALLDASWREYLGLPKGIFTGEGVPSVESLRQSLQHFETVSSNSKYSLLLQREEFQRTYRLLQDYCKQVEERVGAPSESQPSGSPSANAASGGGVRARIQ